MTGILSHYIHCAFLSSESKVSSTSNDLDNFISLNHGFCSLLLWLSAQR